MKQRADLHDGAFVDWVRNDNDLVCAGGGEPRKLSNNFTRTPFYRGELLSERTLR